MNLFFVNIILIIIQKDSEKNGTPVQNGGVEKISNPSSKSEEIREVSVSILFPRKLTFKDTK